MGRKAQSSEGLQSIHGVDGGTDPPDQFERGIPRMNVMFPGRGFAWRQGKRQRPPRERREKMLAIRSPCVVKADHRATVLMQLRQIETQQVMFPGASILDGERGCHGIGHVSSPIASGDSLP